MKIFPGKCKGCGLRILQGALCPECNDAYVSATGLLCIDCDKKLPLCRCIPESIKGHKVCGTLRLFYYDPSEPYSPTSRMIYALKRKRSRQITEFFAIRLAASLRSFGICGSDWSIVYVPRSRKGIAAYGYDHVKWLAHALSKHIDSPVLPAIVRRGNLVQKRLGAAGRSFAAANSYVISENAELVKKKVILLDDLITTGATLKSCIGLLYDAKVSRIFCALVAESRRSKPSDISEVR